MKQCLNCEREFEPKRERAKFCSDLCRATLYQNIKNNVNGVICLRIYGLINPINNQIFYVGKTIGSLNQRLAAHIKDKEGNVKKREIIKGLIDQNISPSIRELECISFSNESEEEAALLREDFWIKECATKAELSNTIGIKQTFRPRFLEEYIKSGSKSGSTSIRVDLDKLNFLRERENKPDASIQKIIDFLFDKYWWENKPHFETKVFPKQSKNIPNISLNQEDYKPEAFDHFLNPTDLENKPPSNLKGIDLAIWKSENKNK